MSKPMSSVYSSVERANHWVVSVSIIVLLTIGWALYFKTLGEPMKDDWRDFHKALGTLLIAFGIWRVGFRLVRGFPDPVSGISPRQALLARAVHYLLLAGIVIMPASGFAKSWFAGRQIDMFGLFTIGTPQTKNDALQQVASNLHFFAGLTITTLILLHVAGALKHHFVDRDDTLKRMIRG